MVKDQDKFPKTEPQPTNSGSFNNLIYSHTVNQPLTAQAHSFSSSENIISPKFRCQECKTSLEK